MTESSGGLWAVIPVFNRKAETLACLERLRLLRDEAPGLRVVIADDGSTDGTAEAVRSQYPEVVVVTGQGHWWWTGGMRAGVEAALAQGARSILSMNDDTLVQPGSLARLVALARAEPKSLVAPIGIDEQGQLIESGYVWAGIKGWTLCHRLPDWDERRLGVYRCGALAGACVIIPADAFRLGGSYAPELPNYHADLEFCARIARLGYSILVDPEAVLLIKANQKNADLLGGDVDLRRLRWMFRYPSGAYHPRILYEFYARTHPSGRLAGALYAAFVLLKSLFKLLLNLSGLGRRLRE